MTSDRATCILTGLILVLPGIYLLWYAHRNPDFYREKRWEGWHGRAALVGLLFGIVHRLGGAGAVKHAFHLFAVLCIAAGVWAATRR